MIKKRVLILIIILSLMSQVINPWLLSADDLVKIRFSEIAYPFVPQLSELRASANGSLLGDLKILKGIEAEIWYQCYSPFLWPMPFVELGTEIFYYLHIGKVSSFGFGVGSAMEFWDGKYSAPFIGSLVYRTHFLRWKVGLGTRLNVFYWPDGLGAELSIPIDVRLGPNLDLGLQPGMMAAVSLLSSGGVVRPFGVASLSYSFGGRK